MSCLFYCSKFQFNGDQNFAYLIVLDSILLSSFILIAINPYTPIYWRWCLWKFSNFLR